MFRKVPNPLATLPALAAILLGLGTVPAPAQNQRPRIDIDHYTIAATIRPAEQDLSAKVSLDFTAVDDDVRFVVFELNNAMQVDKVTDGQGEELRTARNPDDFTLQVNLPQPLAKGARQALNFQYSGTLTGNEDSPVWGIKFAAIHPDYAFLMYPSRWFPVSGYTADRFKASLDVTVPEAYRVIASGIETSKPDDSGDKIYHFDFTQPSFPGSIAVVREQPQVVESDGVTTTLYFRGENQSIADAYGRRMGQIMTFLTGLYGLPPQKDLAVVETEPGTPKGYAAPGILFLSSSAVGDDVDDRLLVNQMSRQWWGVLTSPATRNHLWLTNGAARYSELLWDEEKSGAGAAESEMHDNYVEALTVNDVPLIQSSRLEDYSPEFWAATAGKGSAVLNMLRQIVGKEAFQSTLKRFLEQYAWKPFYTDDFRKVVEAVTGRSMKGFFIQWIESSGAPEFNLDYTVYRTHNGFRIMGKITQDLDTFRMPVKLRIETEGNPEDKTVEVVGASSDFVVDTFGKPKKVILDPDGVILRYDDKMRVAVAIRRGEQFAEIGEFVDALKEYQKALDVNRYSSLAHYRVAEVFFLQRNYQSSANEFREALAGDLQPPWTEVWSHINLGKIFDITDQRDRAVNEYNRALRTHDDTQGAQAEAAKYLQHPYQRPRDRV